MNNSVSKLLPKTLSQQINIAGYSYFRIELDVEKGKGIELSRQGLHLNKNNGTVFYTNKFLNDLGQKTVFNKNSPKVSYRELWKK